MPAYHQIQTYQIVESNSKAFIEKYKHVLKNIGCWDQEIEKLLNNFNWTVEDNGFVYLENLNTWQRFLINNIEFRAIPHLLGWTPKGYPLLKKNYLEAGLLFQSSDLEEIVEGEVTYKKNLEESFFKIMFEFANYFQETGIYLTNEV